MLNYGLDIRDYKQVTSDEINLEFSQRDGKYPPCATF